MKKLPVISIDEDIESADWAKQSWDLPPYKSQEFMALFPDIDSFRKLPVYKNAVENGLILDDEWVAGSVAPIRRTALPAQSATVRKVSPLVADKHLEVSSAMQVSSKSSAIPSHVDLMQPLIEALRMLGDSGTVEEIYEKTVEVAGLSNEVLSQLHDPEKSSYTEVGYRLAWARTYLRKFGVLENSSRGVWSLTEKGKNTPKLDPAEVVKFVRSLTKTATSKVPASDEPAGELPEDEDWKAKLSAVLTQLDPSAFERLVQRVLRESGFIQVEVTGRTGDGGIDGKGIARIHGFMSFHVLFQCKRYKGTVSASAIRDFRGAMVGRADKGLFITTGSFTPSANKEATRDGAPPIDLVNGDELSEKLKELALGVRTERVVAEKVVVDASWFKGL